MMSFYNVIKSTNKSIVAENVLANGSNLPTFETFVGLFNFKELPFKWFHFFYNSSYTVGYLSPNYNFCTVNEELAFITFNKDNFVPSLKLLKVQNLSAFSNFNNFSFDVNIKTSFNGLTNQFNTTTTSAFLLTLLSQNLTFNSISLSNCPSIFLTYDWIHCLMICLGFFIVSLIGLLKNTRDILRLLISLELLLLSVCLFLVLSSTLSFDIKGFLFAMILLTCAACESVVGLGLVINLFKKLKTALWFFLTRLRR